MPTLSEATAAQSARLTAAFKAEQNRNAAKLAALIALYYRNRVDPQSAPSVERWLNLMVPRLVLTSDNGARSAANFFDELRRLEAPGNTPYAARASLGVVDEGVRKSLIFMGPQDYLNKMADIRRLDVSPQQEKAMLVEAKQVTGQKLAQAAVRHAQAGGRQTIFDNAAQDRTCLGWVRVTRAQPCWFCAMLAGRGLQYRPFKEDSFDLSNQRFSGDGDAKVHDKCGCSLKPVYADNDPLVEKTEEFADLWARWGAGGGDAALRFRRGYEHWRETGEYLSFEEANEGLR